MLKIIKKIKDTTGAVALILVVMITTLTLVSAVSIALINISDLTANFHVGQAEQVQANVDTCVNESLYRLASSTDTSGSFTVSVSPISCAFDISIATGGIKYVTSTATTTGDLGSWSRGVKMEVNVSSAPIVIESYKDIIN